MDLLEALRQRRGSLMPKAMDDFEGPLTLDQRIEIAEKRAEEYSKHYRLTGDELCQLLSRTYQGMAQRFRAEKEAADV